MVSTGTSGSGIALNNPQMVRTSAGAISARRCIVTSLTTAVRDANAADIASPPAAGRDVHCAALFAAAAKAASCGICKPESSSAVYRALPFGLKLTRINRNTLLNRLSSTSSARNSSPVKRHRLSTACCICDLITRCRYRDAPASRG